MSRELKEEINQIEKSLDLGNLRRPCEVSFNTYLGIYNTDVLHIAEVNLDKLKDILCDLRDIRKKLTGSDVFIETARNILDSLIYIADAIREMKEGENKFYLDCLKELATMKDCLRYKPKS